MEQRNNRYPAKLDMTVPALSVWNLMGGQIEWQALEPIAALVGIEDVPELIEDLIVIRDNMNKEAQRGRS